MLAATMLLLCAQNASAANKGFYDVNAFDLNLIVDGQSGWRYNGIGDKGNVQDINLGIVQSFILDGFRANTWSGGYGYDCTFKVELSYCVHGNGTSAWGSNTHDWGIEQYDDELRCNGNYQYQKIDGMGIDLLALVGNVPGNYTFEFYLILDQGGGCSYDCDNFYLSNWGVNYKINFTIPAPQVTAPATIDFYTGWMAKKFTLSGQYLNSTALTLSATTGFSVSTATISHDGTVSKEIIVTADGTQTTGILTIGGGGLAAPKVVNLTYKTLPTYNTICDQIYNASSTDLAAYFTWTTLPDGRIEISIFPNPTKAGSDYNSVYFRINGKHGGFDSTKLQIDGRAASTALFDEYFKRTLIPTKSTTTSDCYDKIILTPKKTIPFGTQILYSNSVMNYRFCKVNGTSQGTANPNVTMAFTYGAVCQISAFPSELIFNPDIGDRERIFELRGDVIAGSTVTLTPTSSFEIMPTAGVTVNPNGTAEVAVVAGSVAPINITVRVKDNVSPIIPTSDEYITITDGVMLHPTKVYLTAIGYSTHCERFVTHTNGDMLLTVTSKTINEGGTDKTQVIFSIKRANTSDIGAYFRNNANNNNNIYGVGIVSSSGDTAKLTPNGLYSSTTGGTVTEIKATFSKVLPNGAEVTFANGGGNINTALTWHVVKANSTVVNCNIQNYAVKYIVGTSCP